jgi:hypothetical protein
MSSILKKIWSRMCQEDSSWKLIKLAAVFLSICSLSTFQSTFGLEMDGQPGSLDPSWSTYMYQVFLNKTTVGTDYIWSYGPLGFLAKPILINRTLLALTTITQLSLSIVYANVVVNLLKKHLTVPYGLLIIIILFLPTGRFSRIEYMSTLLAIIMLLFMDRSESNKNQNFKLVMAGALLAFAPLIKASMLVTSTTFMVVFVVTMWSKFRGRTLILISSSFISWFLGFFVSGQSIYSAIITPIRQIDFYVGNSSMALKGPVYYFAAVIITVIAAFFIISYKHLRQEIAVLLITGLLSFQAYKEAFIRQDSHVLTYFSIIMWVGLFLWLTFKKYEGDFHSRSKIGFIVILLTSFILLSNNGSVLTGVVHYSESLKDSFKFIINSDYADSRIDQQKKDILNRRPELEVLLPSFQNKSAFSWPWDINALLVTGAKISQPPIPQEHFAFTKQFDTLNSNFFNSHSSPDMGIISFEAIDGRLPFHSSPNTFKTLLSNYEPHILSGNDLIVRKRTVAAEQNKNQIYIRNAKIGEPINVPIVDNAITIAKINLKQTLWGKGVSLFFRQTPLYITQTLFNGRQVQHRLVQQTLENGIIASQSPQSIDELSLMWQGTPINSIKTFTITTPNQKEWGVEYSIEFQTISIPKYETEVKQYSAKNTSFNGYIDSTIPLVGTNYTIYQGWFFSNDENVDIKLDMGIQSKEGVIMELPYVVIPRLDVQKAYNILSPMVGFKVAVPSSKKDGRLVVFKHENAEIKTIGYIQ